MKHFVRLYFRVSGINKRFKAVEKRTGVDALNYDILTYRDVGPWFQNTFMWLFLLEDKYFIERMSTLKKEDPRYFLHMAKFMPLFHSGPQSTITLLKKLDEVSLKVTHHLFPEDLFDTTIPPSGGPVYDMLKTLAEDEKTVPYELINPFILTLGLQFSKLPKNINDLRTITKRDTHFLAHFIHRISEDEELTQKLLSYQDNDELLASLLIAIAPEEPLRYLDYDETVVSQGLSDVADTIAMYEEKPEIIDSLFNET